MGLGGGSAVIYRYDLIETKASADLKAWTAPPRAWPSCTAGTRLDLRSGRFAGTAPECETRYYTQKQTCRLREGLRIEVGLEVVCLDLLLRAVASNVLGNVGPVAHAVRLAGVDQQEFPVRAVGRVTLSSGSTDSSAPQSGSKIG
jgi:hypothetical protein